MPQKKIRFEISLEKEELKGLQQLATIQGRSVKNYIEQMIKTKLSKAKNSKQ